MNKNLVAYVVTAIAFCALDFAWLSLVASNFYKSQIGSLLLSKPNWWPAVLFYILYTGGLVIFCVIPGVNAANWGRAALWGALFGLFAYATYDLSNLATLKGWSLSVTLADMTWGSVASALASTGGYFGVEMLVGRGM